ncbi:hypothetical protein FS837_009339 [Tulasnella sp. UAMH 9824]|nr:hypothetical protein FS837_009339 [Tulasnella sp. UAMH 9824]
MHFDPLSSPERKPLSNPSLSPDKENVEPDQLSMSVYFNRPYGIFSNPSSPEKKANSPKKKGALIDLSFVSEDPSNDDEEMDFGLDGEDDTIKLGPILAGLDVSKTPDLRRIPFGDVGQADAGFNVPVMKLKSMLPETSGNPITPQRTSQRPISTIPTVTTLTTPPTAIRVTSNPSPALQSPSTVRPVRVLTSEAEGPSWRMARPQTSRSTWSAYEYPPLPPSPIDEGTSLTMELPLEGSEDDKQGYYKAEKSDDQEVSSTENEKLVSTPPVQPEAEAQTVVNDFDKPKHLSPPAEQSGARSRVSLDLDTTFDLRNVRFQDVSFDLLKGEMSFLGRSSDGDSVIYGTNHNELDEPPTQSEDDILLKLSVKTDLGQACIEEVKSPREIQLPESRPSSVASTILTDDEMRPHRPRSVLGATSSFGTRTASSSTANTSSVQPGLPERPRSNLGLARRPTTRPETSGKLRPIRSADIGVLPSANIGEIQEPARPRSKLLTAVLRPPSRATGVDETPVDRLPARTIKHGRASSVGTLRGVPSLASLSSKVVTSASRLVKPENSSSQSTLPTKTEPHKSQATTTLALRKGSRPSSVSALPTTLGATSRPGTSLGISSKPVPAPAVPTSSTSQPRPSIASSRPSIAPLTNKPRASTVLATPRPNPSSTASTASKLPATLTTPRPSAGMVVHGDTALATSCNPETGKREDVVWDWKHGQSVFIPSTNKLHNKIVFWNNGQLTVDVHEASAGGGWGLARHHEPGFDMPPQASQTMGPIAPTLVKSWNPADLHIILVHTENTTIRLDFTNTGSSQFSRYLVEVPSHFVQTVSGHLIDLAPSVPLTVYYATTGEDHPFPGEANSYHAFENFEDRASGTHYAFICHFSSVGGTVTEQCDSYIWRVK